MGNLLFDIKGRINAADFQRGSIILIVASFIISMSGYFSMMLGMLLGIVSLVMVWCWIALWIKRYHDSGKSGWTMLIPLVVWIVLILVVSAVVKMIAPVDPAELMAAAEGGDFMAIMQSSMAAAKTQIIPTAIGNSIASLAIVFLFNGMIKSDPEENRFGPATS